MLWKATAAAARRYGGRYLLTTMEGRYGSLTTVARMLGHSRVAFFSSSIEEEEPRESMPFDVLIVGGGPAGLAASIRLKQLCQSTGQDLSVCVIDKGR